MNDLFQTSPQGPTMTSQEIADLVESRHSNVKRTIDRLIYAQIIGQPPMENGLSTDAQGKTRKTSMYLLTKRDSYVIVAQLSPAFTARLVDRWQALENAPPPVALTGPQLMAAALIEANTTMQAQALRIADMREDVDALARLETAKMTDKVNDRYNLNMPDGWRAVLKAEAKKSRRSLNAEIIAAIQTSMRIKGVNLDE